jgi:hypothetical protein
MTHGFRWAWLALALFVFVLPSSAQDEKKDAKKTDVKKDIKKKGDDSDDDTKKKGKEDDSKDTKKKKDDDPNKIIIVGLPVVGDLLSTEGKLKIRTKRRVFTGKGYELRDADIELELGDKASVRTEGLPTAFDDKGKIKQYSKAELAELKTPDKNVPGLAGTFGYVGSMDMLKPSQKIRVYLGKPKSAAKTDPPRVIMIHIAGNGGE